MSPDTCFRRWPIAQPCSGSSARIFRINRSSVPWTRSDGRLISDTEMTIHLLLSVSKRSLSSREAPNRHRLVLKDFEDGLQLHRRKKAVAVPPQVEQLQGGAAGVGGLG